MVSIAPMGVFLPIVCTAVLKIECDCVLASILIAIANFGPARWSIDQAEMVDFLEMIRRACRGPNVIGLSCQFFETPDREHAKGDFNRTRWSELHRVA